MSSFRLDVSFIIFAYFFIDMSLPLCVNQVMAFYDEPQWCVVGDTFPVGCKWGKSIVYGDDSFKENPDTYNTKYKLVPILTMENTITLAAGVVDDYCRVCMYRYLLIPTNTSTLLQQNRCEYLEESKIT